MKDKIVIVQDIETTSLDKEKDYIIQYAAIKVDTSQNKIIDSINLMIKPDGPFEIAIQAYIRHGIKPEDLKDKPTLKEVAPQIIEFLNNDYPIVTYNGTSFDNPFIVHQLNKLGYIDFSFSNRKCYDSYLEEKRRVGMKLDEVYERYTGKSVEDSGFKTHDALCDVKITYSVFKSQMDSIEFNSETVYGDDGFIQDKLFKGKMYPCFTFGKYRELPIQSVAAIDQEYLKWCLTASFTKTTKEFIKKFIK